MLNKTDLILIRPNDKKAVYGTMPDGATASDPPYWLALMGGYMKQQGINIVLIDAEGENLSPEDTVARIKEYNPFLVGILTLGSNLTASTWKMHGTGVLARAIKDGLEELPIFLWGYHVSSIPEKTLLEESADFVIAGEGFTTIVDLLKSIKSGEFEYSSIQGLWYKDGDKVLGNGNIQLITDLDSLPYDGWDMLPVQKYRNHLHFAFEDLSKRDRYGAIMTSLGCPYNCTYCAISYFSGDKKMRYKSPEKVIAEIEYWVNKYDVYYLRILDECFTYNRDHVFAVCNAIIDSGHKLSIWINARADLVDKEMLAIMYKAGIRWIGYGFESGSIRIRETVQKGQYDLEKIKNVVKMTHEAGIHICSNFMFGLPGDDLESMKDSLALAKELCCEWPNFYCTMAYPGSRMYREAVLSGSELPDNWLGYAQLSYETHPFPTEHLTANEILAFRDYAFNDFFNNPKYIEMIETKFGHDAVMAVYNVLKSKLKRKLLGD